MTEFQAATLSIQQAQVAVALLVGAAQVGVIAWGIRALAREGEKRDRQHERRHTEAMRALE